MAVAIALDKPSLSARSDVRHGSPPASANPCLPHGNAPFAAVLAKTQPQAARRAALPRAPVATSDRSNEPASGDASPSAPARNAGAPRAPAAPQRPDANPATTAESSAKTQETSPGDGAGRPPAKNTTGTSAQAYAATPGATTAREKSAGNETILPPAAWQPVAAAPDLSQNAVGEAAAQATAGLADPSAGEQSPILADTVGPIPQASPAPLDEAGSSTDPDAAPSESPALSSGKPALPAALTTPDQDVNTADSGLLLQATPTDAAALLSSHQAVPRMADTAPAASDAASDWAEARAAIAVRVGQALQDGVQNVSINLHPAELGHVGIELSFHAGGVSVQMTLSRQDTYEAFSRDRAALEQQLAQTGITLGSGGLNLHFDQKRDQPRAFSETSRIAHLQPGQRSAATPPAARPRTANGLLNIIA